MGLTTRYDAGFGKHKDKDYVMEYEETTDSEPSL